METVFVGSFQTELSSEQDKSTASLIKNLHHAPIKGQCVSLMRDTPVHFQ